MSKGQKDSERTKKAIEFRTKVWSYLVEVDSTKGNPPTARELGASFGKTQNYMHNVLSAMKKEGCVRAKPAVRFLDPDENGGYTKTRQDCLEWHPTDQKPLLPSEKAGRVFSDLMNNIKVRSAECWLYRVPDVTKLSVVESRVYCHNFWSKRRSLQPASGQPA